MKHYALLLTIISIEHYERVSVFLPLLSGKEIASFLRCIKSTVACLAVPYFSTLPHKRQGFRKNNEHKTCVLIFSTTLKHFSI
jgi:hypothetical protein